MQKAFKNSIRFVIILLIAQACANKKKIIYFQGDKAIVSDTSKKYSPVYKADDLLSITVMALDADAAKPFNLATYGNLSNDKNITANSVRSGGYLIDQSGDIEFPVIGKIKLAGLNRAQATALIKSKLIEYIKDPAVHIELLNFKVTILGDVNKPGNYNIPNERITLIEALGMAGDLNLNGIRKNILIIRDNGSIKSEARIDLTTKEIFNSPYFYLQQNDVIYVEPNRSKRNSSVVNPAGVTILLALTTVGVTLLNLLIR